MRRMMVVGVPWVNPNNDNNGQTHYAGGVNQPLIHVVHDTAMAGYNVILSDSDGQRSMFATHVS